MGRAHRLHTPLPHVTVGVPWLGPSSALVPRTCSPPTPPPGLLLHPLGTLALHTRTQCLSPPPTSPPCRCPHRPLPPKLVSVLSACFPLASHFAFLFPSISALNFAASLSTPQCFHGRPCYNTMMRHGDLETSQWKRLFPGGSSSLLFHWTQRAPSPFHGVCQSVCLLCPLPSPWAGSTDGFSPGV